MNRLLVQSIIIFNFLFMSGCDRNDNTPDDTLFDIYGSIDHGGQKRTYHVHLPPTYYHDSKTYPLLLGFHGGGGSADNFEDQSGLSAKADEAGFIIVYPDGAENPGVLKIQTWNAGRCCGANANLLDTDDVGFVSKVITEIISKYRVDEKKVYATGHSNGAMMCYRLADELSDRIAAIAPNAGNFQIKGSYDPARNVPVINIISKLDENVIYAGGMTKGPGGQYNPPSDSCLNVIAGLAGCSNNKVLVQQHQLYNVYQWGNCDEPSFEILLYLTEDVS